MTWNYIAGFVDGEGSIVKRKRGYALLISQTNFEVLDQIRNFIGKGHVYPITKRKKHWKEAWVYSVSDNRSLRYVLTHLRYYLIVKKFIAEQALHDLKVRAEEIEAEKKLKNSRRKKGRALRAKGWSYRRIGKSLNMDFGYGRRLILSD